MVIRSGAAVVCVCLLAASGVHAQLRGPVSGHVFDKRTGSIRPVNGLPGSSLLGPALDIPVRLRFAAVHPGLAYAAGITEGDNRLVLIRSLDSTPEIVYDTGIAAGITSLALSASGDTLVAFSAEAKKLFLLNQVPSSPTPGAVIDTTEYGTIERLAVSGDRIAFAASSDSAVQLYLASASEGEARQVATLTTAADIVFASQTDSLFVLEPDPGRVLSVTADGTIETIFGPRDGLTEPSALCADGGRALIANAGDQTAIVADLASRTLMSLPLAARPSRCDRLAGRSLYVLNEAGSSPLVLVDLSTLQSWFVPVDVQ